MAKPKVRKEKLSIYLARRKDDPVGQLIRTENAKHGITLNVSGATSAELFIKRQPIKNPPPWTQLFTRSGGLENIEFGSSADVGAVFIVRMLDATFLLTFGSGFHLLKPECVEKDFGLKVTLNSVDPDKLRSLDKASYDHNPLNSRTQSTRDVDIFNLHLDFEMEMLYAITGTSLVEAFGTTVTGRDALTLAVDVNLNGIPKILNEALLRYKAKLPEKFRWVDNINRVRDIDELDILDMELDSHLANNPDHGFWLGEPEIVDWEDQLGYSFDLYPRTPRHVVLSFHDFTNYINRSPSVQSLRDHTVHVNNSEYRSIKSWSVYRCLYAELSYSGHQYILRNGIWYRINSDFVMAVDEYLFDLKQYDFKFPIYSHDREEDYNAHVVNTESYNGFILMDKKNIKIGGSYDKLEHCDLVRYGKEFIHVKFYRSSSTLSHLFFQGSVAAEAFIKDSWYREKLNPKLPSSMKLADPGLRPDPKEYKIVYAIATTKSIPKDLPFFSKVTLKNSLKNLRALGYEVQLARIEVDPLLAIKKKCKPTKL